MEKESKGALRKMILDAISEAECTRRQQRREAFVRTMWVVCTVLLLILGLVSAYRLMH